jgi:hypothetical protein
LKLDYKFSDTGSAPSGSPPPPWLTATFNDGVVSGSVQLTPVATNLVQDEFVSDWYLNLDPAHGPILLDITYALGGPEASNISTEVNAFEADGDGFFDILFEFPTALDTFGPDDFVVYNMEASEAITASCFY